MARKKTPLVDADAVGYIARGIGNRAGFHDGEVDRMLGGISFAFVPGSRSDPEALDVLTESANRAGCRQRLPVCFLDQCEREDMGFVLI